MKFLFGFVFYLLLTTFIYGQNPVFKNVIGIEVLGSTDIYSINYSRIFNRNYAFQTGFSWLPGTWQMGGNNDRSFIYIPLLFGHQFHLKKLLLALQAGTSNRFILHKDTYDNVEMRVQFGVKSGIIIFDNFQVGAGLYYKTPFYLSISQIETFVYNSKSGLFWPSVTMDYKF